MKDEPFEKLDDSLMKDFKVLREKKIPPDILKGFSASVERKILDRLDQKRPGWLRSWLPVFVPALGILVIVVSTLIFKNPINGRGPITPSSSLPIAFSMASDISEEIAALEALGVWTEEDDAAVDESLIEVEPANGYPVKQF